MKGTRFLSSRAIARIKRADWTKSRSGRSRTGWRRCGSWPIASRPSCVRSRPRASLRRSWRSRSSRPRPRSGWKTSICPTSPRSRRWQRWRAPAGLEELAGEILEAAPAANDLDARSRDFANPDRQVPSGADALLGAGHILAEQFSERADLRQRLREILQKTGKIVTTQIAPDPAAAPAPVSTKRRNRKRRSRAGSDFQPARQLRQNDKPRRLPAQEAAAIVEPAAGCRSGGVASAHPPETGEAPPAAVSVAEVVAEEVEPVPAAEKSSEAPATAERRMRHRQSPDLPRRANRRSHRQVKRQAIQEAERTSCRPPRQCRSAEAKPAAVAAAARRARDRERAKAEKQNKKEAKKRRSRNAASRPSAITSTTRKTSRRSRRTACWRSIGPNGPRSSA